MSIAACLSTGKDDWQTPPALFNALDAEFHFAIDVAASAANSQCGGYFGVDGIQEDGIVGNYNRALRAVEDGTGRRAFWCNPPYSRGLQPKFIAKAAAERLNGYLTVMLLPARTDTRAFHYDIWNIEKHQPREGVEVRFLKGRLRFVGAPSSAPFPSMIVVFRP